MSGLTHTELLGPTEYYFPDVVNAVVCKIPP